VSLASIAVIARVTLRLWRSLTEQGVASAFFAAVPQGTQRPETAVALTAWSCAVGLRVEPLDMQAIISRYFEDIDGRRRAEESI
jgi:hypothetical protein